MAGCSNRTFHSLRIETEAVSVSKPATFRLES
jgi:hypothetical protein